MDRAVTGDDEQRIRSLVRDRYPNYEVVFPGDSSFVCKAQECLASCCRSLTVPADDRDAARIGPRAGIPRSEFLESEHGIPIGLPLAQPYVLARIEGKCVFLGDDQSCGVYEDRPLACRSYPMEILLVREPDGLELLPSTRSVGDALESSGRRPGARPVLIRHRDCPGFDGPPLTEEAWTVAVLDATALKEEREARTG